MEAIAKQFLSSANFQQAWLQVFNNTLYEKINNKVKSIVFFSFYPKIGVFKSKFLAIAKNRGQTAKIKPNLGSSKLV
ncbi:MAG: hypothetical protein ACRC2S_21310 [Waterburya sp.]